MNIEELKKQAETEIADFIAQKIAELNKNTGKEVSEIRFTAREKMTAGSLRPVRHYHSRQKQARKYQNIQLLIF